MRNLTNWLQTNPIIVLTMFIVSFTSGIAGLLLGWKQLYQDYLSKTVELPVWLFLLLPLVLPGLLATYQSFVGKRKTSELVKVEGKKFGVQQVVLDGKAFERCEFHGTEAVIEGTDAFSLVKCEFHSPRFSFSKNAAMTLAVLTKLYSDTAFRPLIDKTIENIRSGEHPEAVIPTALKP